MVNDIKYITKVSPQDKNVLENLNYQNLDCNINFKDLLVSKPWGSEYLLFENELCAIWVLNINYMENTSMHCHPQKDTSLVCIDGQVSCNTLNENNKLDTLDGVFLNKKVFHQTQSIFKEGSYILEIETPVNKFDLVRINDTYGRQGKEYEDKKHYDVVLSLTLEFPFNLSRKINDTKIEVLKVNKYNPLRQYDGDSIISVLSQSNDVGKIYRLKDIEIKQIPINSTIIVISKSDNL